MSFSAKGNPGQPFGSTTVRTSVSDADRTGIAARDVRDVLKRMDSGGREFEFNSRDFERIKSLIHQHAGISLAESKQDMVYSRLARRLRILGFKRFSEYLDYLSREKSEWEHFVNALTTNLTSFFREPHHFELLAQQMKKRNSTRVFKIWCAASSTGEEAYSLAITALEALGPSATVQILASDLDTAVLEHARKGLYSHDKLERMEPERVRRFFVHDAASGLYSVKPELKRLITFRQINLLDQVYQISDVFDVVFCRNVMIYFDKPTQYKVLANIHKRMGEGALLYAGHSENFIHAANLFRSIGRTVYEKIQTA